MKTYYFRNPEHMEDIYGSDKPICFDTRAIHRLAEERGMLIDDLLLQFHKATEAEIAEYGVVDIPLSIRAVYYLWVCAVDSPNRDAYISREIESHVWRDVYGAEIPSERYDYLGGIWDAAHMGLDFFLARSGMREGEFCAYFAIEYKFYKRWAAKAKAIPEHVRMMLARGLNII